MGNIAHLAAYRRDRGAATFRLGLERCAFNGAISSTPILFLLHPQLPTLALCVSTSRLCHNRPRAVQQIIAYYSIISSACIIKDRGTSRPSALAVFRLMTSSNFVTCWNGRSAGFSPLRICPA